jgi:hypothetical protein
VQPRVASKNRNADFLPANINLIGIKGVHGCSAIADYCGEYQFRCNLRKGIDILAYPCPALRPTGQAKNRRGMLDWDSSDLRIKGFF